MDEANDCSAGVTLRFFVISPFMGDFVHRLNVVAADYAGSCACAQVLMLSKKQWFEPRRIVCCGLVACGSLSVSNLLLLSDGQGSAPRTENNTAGGWFMAR
jgi:hypothetical protein